MLYKLILLFIPYSTNYYHSRHWNHKYRDKNKVKKEFSWVALEAKLPMLDKVHITHQFYLKNKNFRFRDTDNTGEAVKMVHDAIKGYMAGDDTSENLSFAVLPFMYDKKKPRWEITVETK